MSKNEHVVVAVLEDLAAARVAVEALRKWDKVTSDVKLEAIGILYQEGDKVKSIIGRESGRGLRVGALVGVIIGALTGGIGLVGAAAAGGLAGGALGAFFTKSLHLNREECNALGMELALGKAAVVVVCREHEVAPTRLHLEHAGGVARVYVVPADAVDEAAAAYDEAHRLEYDDAVIAARKLDEAIARAAGDMGGFL
jgi:hypothetical protein